MLGAMNFITTILNMRHNSNWVIAILDYFINTITFVGNSVVGSFSFMFPFLEGNRKVKRGNRLHKSIFPATRCTDMVVWGSPHTLGNTAGLPKFTNHLRSFTYLPGYLIGIFIGCMLGDAYMDNRPGIFSLKQSIINFPFIWSTYMLLSSFCASYPFSFFSFRFSFCF